MGKTSTTKASKKKTVSKKKEPTKNVNADPAVSGKDSDSKTKETRATVELKGSKDSSKTVKAAIPIQKKPVLLNDLILKKFDDWQPDNLFAPIPDKSIIPDAPPFVSGKNDQEISQIRTLLFKAFDMKTIIEEGERYAVEKAAAEKAEAERIAAEKAAAEKAEAERIAAEKAAAEKAEAERIAAEKAAAQKAEAERIAAEKAAAEKAEAERIAAEKAAAQKAEAERIAAEKAAAEKAEAERIATEKAAAQKAEAERIAAEKAAAEKAEAERIAAEKAAAEKAEAERIAAEKAAAALERKKAAELQQALTPKVKITYDQPVKPAERVKPALPAKTADPMDKTIVIFAGCLAFLVLILLGTSLCNSQKFYIKTAKNGIEIWQGRFSPKGEKQLISLAGVKAPETVRKVCSEIDVYPIIFSYFLNKADAILDAPGIPDFEGIKYYIHQAEPYAITKELRDAADLRLNSMAQTLLIYKADIAVSRGNIADLETAMSSLYKAKAMNLDKSQAESLDKKINAVRGRLEQLKANPEAAATTKTK